MAYVDPRTALSPKSAGVKILKILHNGGAQMDDPVSEWEGWTIAELSWHNENVLGYRWNGGPNIRDFPNSRNYPTWFIVPRPLARIIRERLESDPDIIPVEIEAKVA